MTTGSSTTERVVRIVTILGESAELLGINQIAEEAGLPPSTVHRTVNTLVELGYARYDPDRRLYAAGPQLLRLAGLVDINGPATIIHPYLESLSQRYGETFYFNTFLPERKSLTISLICEGSQQLRYSFVLGQELSLGVGASGKSVLAHLDAETIEQVWQQERVQDPASLIPLKEFQTQLEKIRSRGWASSDGERLPGARAVATVVRAHEGRVVGGICMTYPAERTPAPVEELGDAVAGTAKKVSHLMGFRPNR